MKTQESGRQRLVGRVLPWSLAALAVVLLYGVLLGLYYHPAPKELAGDEQMYREAAQRILRGEPASLDLLWPPLYPHFLALLELPGANPLLAVQLAQIALLVGAALFLGATARHLFGPGPAVAVATLGTLLFPPLAAFATYLWPEILHLFLWTVALWILICHRQSRRHLPVLGIVLGLAFLTKSLLGPFLPALLAALLWPRRDEAQEKGRQRLFDTGLRAVLVLLPFLATLSPALLANHQRHDQWIVADSSRFNLWLGLQDSSRRSLEGSIAWEAYLDYRTGGQDFASRNRALETKIRGFLEERGWFGVLRDQLGKQYFRLFDHQSYLTAQLPGGPLWAPDSGYRQPSAFLALALRALSAGAHVLLLATAWLGLVYLSPRRQPWLWLLALFLLYNLGLFLFLHVTARYRLQMVPVLLLYAGGFLASLRGQGLGGPAARHLVALSGLLLLLFLSFGAPFLPPPT